ncbi:MAG TPA: DUF3106 domain-containing protein [Verrucomicrobiae bacterium]|jgi:Protein of unknown function (DUF3106)|nr:DUF3106 domain-containing protein [Verrucomicrobiae bacterium]
MQVRNWLATAAFSVAVASAVPCLAQRSAFRPVQQRRPSPAYQAPRQQSRPQNQPRGHAGDWLRRYKDMPPAEQERELQNDPAFRRLPPERQQILRQRLQHFSSLPPQQQLRMLNRMETWEHLTPQQKQQARQIFNQMRQLPPARQRMVMTAVRDLRSMPPDQRESVINSDRFRGMFSDQERNMMREATKLPLAPPEEGPQE